MIANPTLARALRQTGRAATRATNAALLPAVVTGDPQAIKEMIETNTALVAKKVRQYTAARPSLAYMSDDLVSAGFVGLVDGVQRLASAGPNETPNVTSYLAAYIEGAIKRAALDSQTGCCASLQFERAAAGKALPQPVGGLADHEPFSDPTALYELREEIAACCESDLDQEVLRLREAGFTDLEIARQLGISKTTVFNARKAIEARYIERCNTSKS